MGGSRVETDSKIPDPGGRIRLAKKFFQPKDSEGRIVGKETVRVPFP